MSVLRFSATNHPQQVRVRGVDDTVDDRRTPASLWASLHERYDFTVDVAASAVNARVPRYFTRTDNGLIQSWVGERVWCNPPFSDVRPWVEKATWEMVAGCALVVMLVPNNRAEQRWWQELVEPVRDCGKGLRVQFLPGRPRFQRPDWVKPAKGDRPPFGLALLIWEPLA